MEDQNCRKGKWLIHFLGKNKKVNHLKALQVNAQTSHGLLDLIVRILFSLVLLLKPFLNRGKAFYDENNIFILLCNSAENDQASDGQ